MEKIKQNTRVTYNYSRKISDDNYGSHEFFCSVSTDCEDKETIEEAIIRASKEVHRTIAKKVSKLSKKEE